MHFPFRMCVAFGDWESKNNNNEELKKTKNMRKYNSKWRAQPRINEFEGWNWTIKQFDIKHNKSIAEETEKITNFNSSKLYLWMGRIMFSVWIYIVCSHVRCDANHSNSKNRETTFFYLRLLNFPIFLSTHGVAAIQLLLLILLLLSNKLSILTLSINWFFVLFSLHLISDIIHHPIRLQMNKSCLLV